MSTSLPRTLPASWYRSKPLYNLEHRAVFHKAWYLLGPLIKFKIHKSVEYELAGVRLLVERASDDEKDIVVRHVDEVGEIAGGNLKTHITKTGLLFTTISDGAPSFEDFFPCLEKLLKTVDFRARPYRRSIQYEGHFNWKTMVDGYQECLHCAYTHPSFSVLYPPTSYAVENHHNWCRHIADPSKPNDGLFLFLFPICTLNVYGGGMSLFRVCPTDQPGTTRMEFDYFNVEEGEKFEEYYKFVRQVALEDYELCEKAQWNLERGVYAEGVLNPAKENGVVYYQQRVLELVLEEHRTKKAAKVVRMRQKDDAVVDEGGGMLGAAAASDVQLGDRSSCLGNSKMEGATAGVGVGRSLEVQ